MGWFTGIVVYVLVWWVTLFAILPWGNRPTDEPAPDGQADGAPVRPRLALKFAVTSAVAAAIWLGIQFLVASDWMSFREMAKVIPVD